MKQSSTFHKKMLARIVSSPTKGLIEILSNLGDRMPVIDRMQFPRKYPLKDVVVILAILGVAVGFMVHNCTQRQIATSVRIEDIRIADFGEQFIRVGYRITNLTASDHDYRLLLTVYADDGQILASSLFMITVPGRRSERRSKLLYRLNRPLQPGERPHNATIELYRRRIL